jgi:hypothetical protein
LKVSLNNGDPLAFKPTDTIFAEKMGLVEDIVKMP